MKHLLIILSILLLSSPLFGQSNTKQWTKKLGTKENDYGDSVTTDSSGNIYVTGKTRGLDGNTGMSGLYDIILMKFDSSGTKQWTKQLVTSNRQYDQGSKSFFDSSGNIYVTGWTPGFSSGIDSDIILIKFNSSGTKQWTKKFGTSSTETGLGGTTDSSGNIYVTGFTRGGLDGNTNSGGKDIFLVKYNSSGTKIWTKQLGTSKHEDAYQVTTDSTGHIYMTGYTAGDLYGNTSSGGKDIFLIKFN